MNHQIFVFRTGSLGDAVAALPAIRSIYNYSGEKINLITNKPGKGEVSSWEVYRHTKYFKDYFEFEKSLYNLFQLGRWIRSKRGKKILFYLVDRSSWKRNLRNFALFKLLGIDEVVGTRENTGEYIERDSKGNLKTVKSEYIRLDSIVKRYFVSKGRDLQGEDTFNFFEFSNDFIQSAYRRFPFLRKEFIVLGIGGKNRIQRWAEDRYVSVLESIPDSFYVVILGGKGDMERARYIEDQVESKKVINLCGRTNILESAFILSKAMLYIGNDTGTTHLASVVGCRCIVVSSGRDNPGRWHPYGDNHKIIRKRVECEGCWLHTDECKNNIKCMDIAPEIVIKTVSEALERVKVGKS